MTILTSPSYEGFEIDMLNLGDADSLIVTRWASGKPTRILIDGGNGGDADKVCAFLEKRGVNHIDHVVCSHPHNDHAAGLVSIVQNKNLSFGQAWMHQPLNHINSTMLQNALSKSHASKVVKIIQESLEIQSTLNFVFQKRGLQVTEPFHGMNIGFLAVCGPTQAYYEELLKDFSNLDKLAQFEKDITAHEQHLVIESMLDEADTLGGTPTEPENNSSTILWGKYGNDQFLFTADAGVQALQQVVTTYGGIANLKWMQIPHHGSRRNVNIDLINHFAPKTAFVSADGNKKHPRRAVVSAFKKVNSEVFSTHYPNGGHLWHHVGNVPTRPDYSSATALYKAIQ